MHVQTAVVTVFDWELEVIHYTQTTAGKGVSRGPKAFSPLGPPNGLIQLGLIIVCVSVSQHLFHSCTSSLCPLFWFVLFLPLPYRRLLSHIFLPVDTSLCNQSCHWTSSPTDSLTRKPELTCLCYSVSLSLFCLSWAWPGSRLWWPWSTVFQPGQLSPQISTGLKSQRQHQALKRLLKTHLSIKLELHAVVSVLGYILACSNMEMD